MTPETAAALAAVRAGKRAVVLATRLPTGEQHLLPDARLSAELNKAAEDVLATDRSGTVSIGDTQWFLQAHNPPLRLIVIGAVHIAQALTRLAAPLGIACIVVDPRTGLATGDRFPGIDLILDWPDTALDGLAPDGRSAIVALTHDPKLDDPALERALASPAFYIGALGSRKSHAARLARLAAAGHDPGSLARIRGPVGLAIGAVTAPEIALSIMAEIVAVLRRSALGTRG
jgi:xanthine dehydrogenase accessory factor